MKFASPGERGSPAASAYREAVELVWALSMAILCGGFLAWCIAAFLKKK
jgi:uncharacterized membrane protein YhdT